MKKKIICKNCKMEIHFRSYLNECSTYPVKKSETFKVTCDKCGKTNEYHLRDIYAVSNDLLNLLILLILLVIIGLVVYFLYLNYWEQTFYIYIIIPLVIAIPMKIYFTYLKSESTKIRDFNRQARFK